MVLSSFSSKGKILDIGNKSTFGKNKTTYLEVKILLDNSEQELDFYLTENENTPPPFKIVSRNFGEFNNYKVNDTIQFDFNIIKNNKNETKLKIWNIYIRS